jgi:hypothetical protein
VIENCQVGCRDNISPCVNPWAITVQSAAPARSASFLVAPATLTLAAGAAATTPLALTLRDAFGNGVRPSALSASSWSGPHVTLTRLPLNPVAALVRYSGTPGSFIVTCDNLTIAGNFSLHVSVYLLDQGVRISLPTKSHVDESPHAHPPIVTVKPARADDAALTLAGSAFSPTVAADSVHRLYVTLRDVYHNVVTDVRLLEAEAARATVLVRSDDDGSHLAPVTVNVTAEGGLYAAYEVGRSVPCPSLCVCRSQPCVAPGGG